MQVNSDLYSCKLLWPYLQFTAAMYPEKRGTLQDCAVSFFCNWRLCTEAVTGSMLLQKSVPKIFTKFSGKHQCQSLISDVVTGLGSANLFKKILGTGFFRKTPPHDCSCFLQIFQTQSRIKESAHDRFLQWLMKNRTKIFCTVSGNKKINFPVKEKVIPEHDWVALSSDDFPRTKYSGGKKRSMTR